MSVCKVVDCVVAPPTQEVGCVVVVGVWGMSLMSLCAF